MSGPARAALAALLLAAAPVAAQRYRVDPARSRVKVRVTRDGALARVLHDHDLVATRISGEVAIDPRDPTRVDVRVTVDADSLREPPGHLSARDAVTVEEQVRAPGILDAAAHPRIELAATRYERGELIGTLTVRGVTHPVRIPVDARFGPDGPTARGHFDLAQSAFGIRRYRKMWGAIAVEDRVRVDFAIATLPCDRATCRR
jgi:polyisoprenoid-binding protein YceI